MGKGDLIDLKELNKETTRRFDRWMNTLELERECWTASDNFDELLSLYIID